MNEEAISVTSARYKLCHVYGTPISTTSSEVEIQRKLISVLHLPPHPVFPLPAPEAIIDKISCFQHHYETVLEACNFLQIKAKEKTLPIICNQIQV